MGRVRGWRGDCGVRAIISAAGPASRWDNYTGVPKHLVDVFGERLLDREELAPFVQRHAILLRTVVNPQDDFFLNRQTRVDHRRNLPIREDGAEGGGVVVA